MKKSGTEYIKARDFSKILNSNNSHKINDGSIFSQMWFSYLADNFNVILTDATHEDPKEFVARLSVAEIEDMLYLLNNNNNDTEEETLVEHTLVEPINNIFENHSFDMYKFWKQKFAAYTPPPSNAERQNQNRVRNFLAEVN